MLIESAPLPLKLEIVELGALTFYNQDLDATPPQEWTTLRQQIKAADAVLFVTPAGCSEERHRHRVLRPKDARPSGGVHGGIFGLGRRSSKERMFREAPGS